MTFVQTQYVASLTMQYLALACDYDGTLATDGHVNETTIAALQRLRNSSRKLLLVTGRELDDLLRVFPQIYLFDLVVAENGALLYNPATRESKLLSDRPSEEFIKVLRDRGVTPLSVGRVIVATWHPHETKVLEVIRELRLKLQVILNKDAVMVLPLGVDKASGLSTALNELGLLPQNTVAVGDAENDCALLSMCGCGVAVANALEILKERANFVTKGARGAGVCELIDQLVASDLGELETQLKQYKTRFPNP